MEITADVIKISKTVQRDLMFIFDVLSEYGINFVSNSIFLATENVVSFTQNDFCRKRGCVTMRKRLRQLMATKWHKSF